MSKKMKNGMLGEAIFRFLKDNHGMRRALFPEMDDKRKEQFLKNLDRKLNPHDDGARLSVGEAEDLVMRIRQHGGEIKPYIEPAIRIVCGDGNDSYALDGFVDDEVIHIVREVTKPEASRKPVKELTRDDYFKWYSTFHRAKQACEAALAELQEGAKHIFSEGDES